MINVWNENVSLPSDGACVKLLGSEEGCVSASSSSWITSWCSFNLKWCFCHQGSDFMSVRKVNLLSSSHSKSFCDSPNFLFSMSKIHRTGTLFFLFLQHRCNTAWFGREKWYWIWCKWWQFQYYSQSSLQFLCYRWNPLAPHPIPMFLVS